VHEREARLAQSRAELENAVCALCDQHPGRGRFSSGRNRIAAALAQRIGPTLKFRRFIEQFRERRNPRPGSTTNAFEEEHYRRIAFANQRFGTASGTPGWQTDRGHIYIVYGAPDEIDSAAPSSPKIEVWTYRQVEGVGDLLRYPWPEATITWCRDLRARRKTAVIEGACSAGCLAALGRWGCHGDRGWVRREST